MKRKKKKVTKKAQIRRLRKDVKDLENVITINRRYNEQARQIHEAERSQLTKRIEQMKNFRTPRLVDQLGRVAESNAEIATAIARIVAKETY